MTKDLTVNERKLLDSLLCFVESMTIKNPSMVKKYETEESLKNAKFFIYVYENKDTCKFEDFVYSYDDIVKVFSDEDGNITLNTDILYTYSTNNNNIPEEYRSIFLEYKLDEYSEENYNELNDYYRMVHGKPSINEIQMNYVYTSITDGKGNNIPIHNLSEEQFYQIKQSGEYDKILLENPEKIYLKYINPLYKVSYYTARTTKDFYPLKYNTLLMEDIYVRQVIDFYFQILVYTMSTVYTKSYNQEEYYDGFIILYMLTATLQKFFTNNIINISDREIYDIDSIRNMFLSYGLPFYDNIPIKYQRKILKNMNTLLSYKGTDKIFVDIADIFGFTDTDIYRYYLVKTYDKDNNSKPIIDKEHTNLEFAQVKLEDKDISSFLKTDYLYQSYEEVVGDDPYWGEVDNEEIDNEFYEELKEYDFNYISTKYLSIGTIFNMSQVAFENCYFFNLMNTMYHKNLLNEMNFYNSSLKSSTESINIFSIITAIQILLYARFGYEDILHDTTTSIASIYGFNFDTDLSELIDYMHDNSGINIEGKEIYYHETPELERLTKILKLPNDNTKEELLNKFFECEDMNKLIKEQIVDTTKSDDYRLYKALESLHTYNMYSNSIKDLYCEDKEYISYSEWLKDNDKVLYDWVQSNLVVEKTLDNGIIVYNTEIIIKAIDTLLESMDLYFNSDMFSNLFIENNITLDVIKQYFLQMVSIFKAYTVQLKKMNIYYLFNDEYLNSLRIFSYIKKTVNCEKADSFQINAVQEIDKIINRSFEEKDLTQIEEFVHYINSYYKKEKFDLIELYNLLSVHNKAEKLNLLPSIESSEENIDLNDSIIKKSNNQISYDEDLQISIAYKI